MGDGCGRVSAVKPCHSGESFAGECNPPMKTRGKRQRLQPLASTKALQ